MAAIKHGTTGRSVDWNARAACSPQTPRVVRFQQPTSGKVRRSEEPEPGYLTRLRFLFLILEDQDGTHERAQPAACGEPCRADHALDSRRARRHTRSERATAGTRDGPGTGRVSVDPRNSGDREADS